MEAQNPTPPFGIELFCSPHREKIQRGLPTLFNLVELENRRGKRLGMEVGTARERVLIALFMYVYGTENVELPPANSPERDILVNKQPLSMKTKSGPGFSGVKIDWGSDRDKIDVFLKSYLPSSHLLYVNVTWGRTGNLFLIPKGVQEEVLRKLTIHKYAKTPHPGTNNRGVAIFAQAMKCLLKHPDTRSLPIDWKRDKSSLDEAVLYYRWMVLWDAV